MIDSPVVQRSSCRLVGAAVLGVLALVPAGAVVVFGLGGIAMPRLISNPIVVLGGIALALLANVGALFRGRIDCREDGVAVECHVRLRYRGANLFVVGAAGALAGVILLYLIVENLGPR